MLLFEFRVQDKLSPFYIFGYLFLQFLNSIKPFLAPKALYDINFKLTSVQVTLVVQDVGLYSAPVGIKGRALTDIGH